MSRIIVETFQRGDGYVAIASYENQIVADGGVGAGGSERSAIQDAVNCLYTREDERFSQKAFIDPVVKTIAEAPITPSPVKGVRRITTFPEISQALRTACAMEPKRKFWLEYTNSQDEFTEREVVALEFREGHGRLGFRTGGQMLVAIDTAKDEPRHFRVDRISAITERP